MFLDGLDKQHYQYETARYSMNKSPVPNKATQTDKQAFTLTHLWSI